MKKTFLLLLVLPLLLGWGCNSKDTGNQNQNTNAPGQLGQAKDYYDVLADGCIGVAKDCCLKTVETLRENKYEFPGEMGCPSGYEMKSLDCEGGYSWCQLKQ